MTIAAILLAIALAYFIKGVSKIRQIGWLHAYVRWANQRLSMLPGWRGLVSFLIILGAPLIALWLLALLLYSLGGQLVLFLFTILVLIYCLGPRNLDSDVSAVVKADTDVERQQASARLLGRELPEDEAEQHGVMTEAVFVQALRRWFAVIFWFAVLGLPGALLYRLSDWLVSEDLHLTESQQTRFWRLREVMEWPVAQLVTLGLAIAADFDSVYSAWKRYHTEQGHSLFEGNNGFLKAAAREAVLGGHVVRDGFADQLTGQSACVQQSMDLVWRVLGVWLTVMALMLLVGWLS